MPIWSPGRHIPTQKYPSAPPSPRDGHAPKTDKSLLRTVSFVPGQRKLLPVAEPDLQIKGEEAGGGHPDPEIRGTGSSHKKNFSTLPQFGLKIREGGGGGLNYSHRLIQTLSLAPSESVLTGFDCNR